jgi:hypothetical protein
MEQIALFAAETVAPPPAPAPVPVAQVRRGPRENLADLIACPVIEAELMEIFRARPDDWLDWPDFRPVIAKRGIGYGLGHKLYSMVRGGLLEERVIYLGKGLEADRPGSKDYQGFRTEYRLAREAKANAAREI